jgi:hypothetical protein
MVKEYTIIWMLAVTCILQFGGQFSIYNRNNSKRFGKNTRRGVKLELLHLKIIFHQLLLIQQTNIPLNDLFLCKILYYFF